MEDDTLKFIGQLRTALDKNTVPRAEFDQLVKRILTALAKREDKLTKDFAAIKNALQSVIDESIQKSNEVNETGSAKIDSGLSNLNRTLEAQTRKVDNRLDGLETEVFSKLATFRDNLDADKDAIVTRAVDELTKLLPEEKSIANTRDELESLEGAERLKMSAIDGLDEKFENIEQTMEQKLSAGKRLGGYTDNHVKFALGRMVKEETPSGTIDGANTDFTTTQAIHAVFSFMLNGESISSSEYTISGNTITFSTAPPAAYSGKDFRIVYI